MKGKIGVGIIGTEMGRGWASFLLRLAPPWRARRRCFQRHAVNFC